MEIVRDRLWLWGHETGSHNSSWNLPGASRMTPLEGAVYMGIPNLIMVGYSRQPAPPFHQYALPLRCLDRVVWSIVGASGDTAAAERQEVVELARRQPNIAGVMMDDFFRPPAADGGVAVLTTEDLGGVRQQLDSVGRPLDLWVVLYDHQLDLPVADHLACCDVVSLWTWEARHLGDLEANLDRAEALSPTSRRVLGCYLWDYGCGRPMPLDAMEHQCQLGLAWLRQGRIGGLIFLASCICDLDLPAVEWTRQWIARVGGEALGG